MAVSDLARRAVGGAGRGAVVGADAERATHRIQLQANFVHRGFDAECLTCGWQDTITLTPDLLGRELDEAWKRHDGDTPDEKLLNIYRFWGWL